MQWSPGCRQPVYLLVGKAQPHNITAYTDIVYFHIVFESSDLLSCRSRRPALLSLPLVRELSAQPTEGEKGFRLPAASGARVRVGAHKKTGETRQAVSPESGGEGGTRTLAPVTRPTPLAGAPRHQLEYFSVSWHPIPVKSDVHCAIVWKDVGGEGGIRTHGSFESPVFKTGSLNRSDTSPYL